MLGTEGSAGMAKSKPKPKPKPKQYDYFFPSPTKVVCFASNVSRCTVAAALLEAEDSEFHDVDLRNATAEINSILSRVEQRNADRARHLCFIDVEGRLMLVWTHPGEAIGGADDARDIAKALKIKRHWLSGGVGRAGPAGVTNAEEHSMAKPKPTPKPPPKRTWKNVKGKVHCYPHKDDDCTVVGLWQAGSSDFHDAPLQAATAQINKILSRVEQENEDPSRRLSFIKVDSRLMLVWTHPGGIGSSETHNAKLAQRLKLKGIPSTEHPDTG
jgi:hypothetical protein